jgi:hypothetical protein
MNKIEIPLSKTKLLLASGGSIMFILLAYYLLTNSELHTKFNSTIVKGIAILGIVFFGSTLFYGIKKMFDNIIGLTIDDNGIFDNSNASSVGLIEWSDITLILSEQVASTKFLLIFTNKPEEYIARAKGLKKKLMQANNKMYGTPLSISATTLRCNFKDLEKLLKEKLKEHTILIVDQDVIS